MLKIYNSLSGSKEELKPIHPNEVRMYVCGMTVYDYCHIGHARPWIVFDVVVRYLRQRGYKVTFVRNITDIDDKIINRAKELNENWLSLVNRFIEAQHQDEQSLKLLPVDHEPRATEYVPQIVKLIEMLIQNGSAYAVENGDVYFDVRKFKDYGKLSKRDLDQLIAGARVEVGEIKRDPLDFALWKAAKPGEPTWDSPWGLGRPGWHIECSAMSAGILGQPFDIHGGGMDLKFPHHENEIAQSEAAYHCDFVKAWMHVGLLMVEGEKMSKSLNNFFRIRDVLKEIHPELLRLFMISGHYRSPVNYSKENIAQLKKALSHLYLAIRNLPEASAPIDDVYTQRFNAVMDDDFNTPEAIAVLFDLSREINRLRESAKINEAAELGATLKKLAWNLGILQENPELFLKGELDTADVETINQLISARIKAREKKDWKEADRIRAQLTEMGVVIEDSAAGTVWRLGNDI